MNFTFIYLAPFAAACKRLDISDDDLRELEIFLAENPEAGKVISGTGGLRKLRFAPAGSGKGKRGGVRIGYAVIMIADSIYFVTAYDKNRQSDISPEEKKAIRSLLKEIEDRSKR